MLGVCKREGHLCSDFQRIYLAKSLKTPALTSLRCSGQFAWGSKTLVLISECGLVEFACKLFSPRHAGEAFRLLLLSYKSLSSFLSSAVETVRHRVGFRHVCLPFCLASALLFWQTKLHVNVPLAEADAFVSCKACCIYSLWFLPGPMSLWWVLQLCQYSFNLNK